MLEREGNLFHTYSNAQPIMTGRQPRPRIMIAVTTAKQDGVSAGKAEAAGVWQWLPLQTSVDMFGACIPPRQRVDDNGKIRVRHSLRTGTPPAVRLH